MKYIITLLIGLGFASSASAQDDWQPYAKGTKLVGFDLNSNVQKTDHQGSDIETRTAVLNGQFGYFVIDGLVLGIDLNSATGFVEQSNQNSSLTLESKQSTFGLFAAYYFRLGAKSAIYPEIRIFGGSEETVIDFSLFGKEKEETSISGATIGLGYVYRINQHIGFDVKLRAGSQTNKVKDSSGENEIEWSNGQFLVGFQLFF